MNIWLHLINCCFGTVQYEREKTEITPFKRRDVELEKSEPKEKAPVPEEEQAPDDKDKYERQAKPAPEEEPKETGLKIVKVEVNVCFVLA